ncbi:tyrosine-type recombinase/integrase [Endozoicomonas sp. G2_1]|uniref:tyrosine-type recombinase/integrase n=1 Tax=Endozoicomonas sp. G2_1 TaxID=2821091 RepID=UPI001ADCD5F2|nr:site-specific integrase [Endozoicomonas sp. G2_1]MBO9492196.1 tyrosine-type recombinase/integrase [Endozoicomonas sp. G2_1]
MKTIPVLLSASVIKKYAGENVQLKDQNQALYFRYSNKNPSSGVFYYRHYEARKGFYIRLGKYPTLSVSDAKKSLKAKARIVSLHGLDAKHGVECKFADVAALLMWWFERLKDDPDKKPKNLSNIKSLIKLHLVTRLKGYAVSDVDEFVFDEHVFRPMRREGYSLGTIEQVILKLKAAYSQAESLKAIPNNPLKDFSLALFTPDKVLSKTKRMNYTDLPVAAHLLAKALPETRMLGYLVAGHAVRICEASGAAWREFDFDNKTWTIPASRVKNKRPFEVKLTDRMIAVLKQYRAERRKAGRASWYLFPLQTKKRKPISANSASRKLGKLFDHKYGAHDFRKLARSWWTDNKVDFVIGEFLLNHKLDDVVETYVQTTAQHLLLESLDNWQAYLEMRGFFTMDVNRLKVA